MTGEDSKTSRKRRFRFYSPRQSFAVGSNGADQAQFVGSDGKPCCPDLDWIWPQAKHAYTELTAYTATQESSQSDIADEDLQHLELKVQQFCSEFDPLVKLAISQGILELSEEIADAPISPEEFDELTLQTKLVTSYRFLCELSGAGNFKDDTSPEALLSDPFWKIAGHVCFLFNLDDAILSTFDDSGDLSWRIRRSDSLTRAIQKREDEKIASALRLSRKTSRAAQKRHQGNSALRTRTIELFLSSKWPSARQAAKSIFPRLQEYAHDHGIPLLSADRGEQTTYEWILQYKKELKKI